MFDAIGIVSSNPEKSVTFYRTLGIELKRFQETDHYEALTKSGIRFLMDSEATIKSFDPNFKRAHGNGFSMCFKQASPAMVDEAFKKALASGGKSLKEPWNAFWGQRYACVLDPDGHQVDLFAGL